MAGVAVSQFLTDYLTADSPIGDEVAPPAAEIVVDRKSGLARQAGADTPEGAWVLGFKLRAERSLYVFCKGVLGRQYLTVGLHRPICQFIQTSPPRRKGVLLPREHGKTSLVSHGLPIHILIQPKSGNIYFPDEEGADQRIILIGETETRATDAMRVIQSAFEMNDTIRALWPHRVWDNPRRESKKWNERECIIPRPAEYPDPSIRAIGVGGAVTGAHPTVLIKDDLVTLEAANSPIVMQTAIEWHIASRALINSDKSLEFIIGTRWAVNDLYEYIMRNDPTVEWTVRSVVENGVPIYPEAFSLEKVAQLQREFGVLFPLLYMNSALARELVDFDMEMIREFEIVGDRLRFSEDDRDLALSERLNAPAPSAIATAQGAPLTRETWQSIYRPGEGIRLRG